MEPLMEPNDLEVGAHIRTVGQSLVIVGKQLSTTRGLEFSVRRGRQRELWYSAKHVAYWISQAEYIDNPYPTERTQEN